LSDVIVGTATIKDPTGLHARPAVKFARLAKRFVSSIEVSGSEQGDWVNAKSTNSLMKMKAPSGSDQLTRARGRDAESAVSELVRLASSDFEPL
jgi:phosphocarrier protein HPr